MTERIVALWMMLGLALPATAGEVARPVSERFRAADVEEVPSFQQHVLPLMGKLGCNGRACHGSFQGQGGFRLSLFGYDFKADHDALLAGENPRVDLEEPEASLILEKATLSLPHKGGKRMDVGSWEYHVFHRWIASGAKGVDDEDRRFERLEVIPSQIVFNKVGETIPLRVIAHWSDGMAEDVTPICRFRTNNESISEIDENGVVTALAAGDTDVVVFYDNGVAPVQTLLPVSKLVGNDYPVVPTPTPIDELVVQKLRKLGIVPSELSDDAEFLRRVSLDMTGTLPAPDEIEAFLADSDPNKRARKIDELLERPAYAAWWTTILCDITGNNPATFDERIVQNQMSAQWYDWIYQRVQRNESYDSIVAGLVLAKSRQPGQSYDEYMKEFGSYFRKDDPQDFSKRNDLPHYWLRRTMRTPEDRALSFAYAFLGVRLQCAQCHKHPFDQWTQDDFKEFTKFFSRVQIGAAPDARDKYRELQQSIGRDRRQATKIVEEGGEYPWREVFVAARPNNGRGNQRRQGRRRPQATVAMVARLLGDESVEIEANQDPRELLMKWLRRSDNPYFARAFVNRVWAAYFGTGIIEPADDLSLANPPSNPELLAYLEQGFIERGFDMKWLHREIANSRTYQLTWKPNETNQFDTRNFSRAVPRRIPAEVAYDALRQATASADEIAKSRKDPVGRAIAPVATRGQANRGRNNNYALTIFGKPARLTNCDCERSNEVSLLQTIYLRNDQEMLSAIEGSGWLREVDRQLRGENGRNARGGRGPDLAESREALQRLERRLRRMREEGRQAQVERIETQIRQLKNRVAVARQRSANADREPEPAPAAEVTERLIREAYLRTVSRPPTEEELALSQRHLAEAPRFSTGLRDLLWALVNTKEFIVNH